MAICIAHSPTQVPFTTASQVIKLGLQGAEKQHFCSFVKVRSQSLYLHSSSTLLLAFQINSNMALPSSPIWLCCNSAVMSQDFTFIIENMKVPGEHLKTGTVPVDSRWLGGMNH